MPSGFPVQALCDICPLPTGSPWWSKREKLLPSQVVVAALPQGGHASSISSCASQLHPSSSSTVAPFDSCSHPLVETQQSRAVPKTMPSSSPPHPGTLLPAGPRRGVAKPWYPRGPLCRLQQGEPQRGEQPRGGYASWFGAWRWTGSSPCLLLGVCFAGPDPRAGGIK